MTIATLEKIHELLKNECWTKQRAQEIALEKLHNKEDFVEELAAAADDKNDPSLVEAVLFGIVLVKQAVVGINPDLQLGQCH